MSQLHKEIDALRQKVYYIDTSVNTFFNKTIINIQKSLNDLNVRITQLEQNLDTNPGNSNDVKPKKVEKKSQNNSNKNNNNSNLPNQIRTISLQ